MDSSVRGGRSLSIPTDSLPSWVALGALALGTITLTEASEISGETEDAIRSRFAEVARDRDQQIEPAVSIVIPVLDEAEGLTELLDRVTAAMAGQTSFEVIVVDDGSRDSTPEVLASYTSHDTPLHVIRLSRNFGHQAALLAGLRASKGRAVAMMDGDGQDPPELLPRLIERWRAGADVVYGVRRARKESFAKRWAYSAFYRLVARLGEVHIPLDAGDFCLMDRQVVNALCELPESTRFLRGLRSWVGFEQVGLEYERPAREHGRTKYGLTKLVRLALEGLLSFSVLPLRMASMLGLLTSLAGVVYLGYAVTARIVSGGVPPGWTSVVCVVLLLGGAQLSVMGVFGEYLARVYTETKRRPAYLIRSVDR